MMRAGGGLVSESVGRALGVREGGNGRGQKATHG